MKPSLTGIVLEELTDFLQKRGAPSYRAKQITDWIYKKRVASFDAMTDLPNELRAQLTAEFDTPKIEVVRVLGSKDTTQKFLFRLRDQNLIESVLIPASPALYGIDHPVDHSGRCCPALFRSIRPSALRAGRGWRLADVQSRPGWNPLFAA